MTGLECKELMSGVVQVNLIICTAIVRNYVYVSACAFVRICVPTQELTAIRNSLLMDLHVLCRPVYYYCIFIFIIVVNVNTIIIILAVIYSSIRIYST